MALFKTWIAEISTNPSLDIRAAEEGLRHIGYERIKPALRGVLTVASARFVLQAGTEEVLCSLLSSFLEHQCCLSKTHTRSWNTILQVNHQQLVSVGDTTPSAYLLPASPPVIDSALWAH